MGLDIRSSGWCLAQLVRPDESGEAVNRGLRCKDVAYIVDAQRCDTRQLYHICSFVDALASSVVSSR